MLAEGAAVLLLDIGYHTPGCQEFKEINQFIIHINSMDFLFILYIEIVNHNKLHYIDNNKRVIFLINSNIFQLSPSNQYH